MTSDDDGDDVGGEKPRGKSEYKVGFCKPPVEHRFVKGQSGNPNGRPPKMERAITHHQISWDLFHLLDRNRKLKTAKGVKNIPGIELLYEQLFQKAIKENDGPSQRFLIRRYQDALRSFNTDHERRLAFINMIEEDYLDFQMNGPLQTPEQRRNRQRYMNKVRRNHRRRWLLP